MLVAQSYLGREGGGTGAAGRASPLKPKTGSADQLRSARLALPAYLRERPGLGFDAVAALLARTAARRAGAVIGFLNFATRLGHFKLLEL